MARMMNHAADITMTQVRMTLAGAQGTARPVPSSKAEPSCPFRRAAAHRPAARAQASQVHRPDMLLILKSMGNLPPQAGR